MKACPTGISWCTDHVDQGDNGKPVHQGDAVSLLAPDGIDFPLGVILTAQLYRDEAYTGPAEAWIKVGEYEEFTRDGAAITDFAERLSDFARQLHAMHGATQARSESREHPAVASA